MTVTFKGLMSKLQKPLSIFTFLLLTMLLLPSANAVPPMVTFACGSDIVDPNEITDPQNVTLHTGENVPAGALVEIINVDDREVLDTFTVGIQNPPGTWHGGQFYYTSGLGGMDSSELPVTVILRVYDAGKKEDSSRYGDSPRITVTGDGEYPLQGWTVDIQFDPGTPVSSEDDGGGTTSGTSSSGNGGENADDETALDTVKNNPLIIAGSIGAAGVIMMALHLFRRKPATDRSTPEDVPDRFRGERKRSRKR